MMICGWRWTCRWVFMQYGFPFNHFNLKIISGFPLFLYVVHTFIDIWRNNISKESHSRTHEWSLKLQCFNSYTYCWIYSVLDINRLYSQIYIWWCWALGQEVTSHYPLLRTQTSLHDYICWNIHRLCEGVQCTAIPEILVHFSFSGNYGTIA